MRKIAVIVTILLMILVSSALATETRVLTMGDNNLVLLDEANIWLFPSRVFSYPNLAIGEFSHQPGENDFTRFGIHWKFGTDNPLIFGTYFSDVEAAAQVDNLLGENIVAWDTLDHFDSRRIDLFYGNGLGAYNFGTRLSLWQSGAEQNWDDPVDQSKESFAYYDFDVGITPESGMWDAALNFALGTWTDEDALGRTDADADGFFDFSVLGRYFLQRGPDYTFIPHVKLAHNKRGIKDYYLDDDTTYLDLTTKYTKTVLDFGFGMNYTPARGVLAVCDFGFAITKWKDETEQAETPDDEAASLEDTESSKVLPYLKIGLDADVFKWMDIRLGATSLWTSESIEDKNLNNETKYKFAENETYLGFGFHWKRLHIDTYADPQLFLDGFNFISGSMVRMNFRISAVYEMM